MQIAIWGAGKFGNYILRQIKDNNTVDVICIIDKNPDLNMEQGIKVVTPSVFTEEYSNKIDCILVAFLNGRSVRKQLMDMNVKAWGIIMDRVWLEQLQVAKDLKNDNNILWNDSEEIELLPVMETLETNVVDYCNLNCKGCSHFSNIFSKDAQIPYEIFERDIKFLSSKVYVRRFYLLGGEALLNKSIKNYFQCIRENMCKTEIVLVTNGLLIPNLSEEVLESMIKFDVVVSITEYPPVTKMKDKIMAVLEKFRIEYEFREQVDTFGKNIDLSGKNNPMESQKSCREKLCQFLRNGKIYKCPFSALGNYYFDYYNISLHFEEGIDIFDESLNWDLVVEKLRKQPIELCKYCGIEERFKWEVSGYPDKDDWLI